MSWFAGVFNSNQLSVIDYQIKCFCDYEFEFRTNNLLLWSDKNNTNISQNSDRLKILCGIVLQNTSDNWKMIETAWLSEYECSSCCGHYIGLEYTPKGITIYNDKFGLRELYYFQDDETGTIYFSTRMDILLNWRDDNVIDWEEFGSYWLNRDPLGKGYFIKGIKRLNQAGRIRISNNQIHKTNGKWTAEPEEKYSNENLNIIIDNLVELLKAPDNSGYQTELALSGGYDSRSLLAIMKHTGIDFEAITWGRADHPDVILAKELAKITGICHKCIFNDIVEDDNSWQRFYDYCGRTQLVVMGTAVFELYHYHEIDKARVLLDGGSGEYIRRCLNANLEYRGRQAIIDKNAAQILRYMPRVRVDIFGEEQLQSMREGLLSRAEKAVSEMPDASKVGIGNWIETWDVRQRVSNISSRSQQVLDDIIKNYMPYIQPQIIEAAMKIPANIRAKNKILEEILIKYAAELRKLPTIRNGLRMRYGIGRIEGKLRAVLQKEISYSNDTNRRFLVKYKDRINDMASECQKLSDIYEPEKVNNLIRRYYQEGSGENEVIWWLSFEVYRQQFGIKK
ncbi:MAG: hypothetical protein RAO94_06575 [Candidatus Stygibacter australis]|nr:hypothetical protein [Candidatus Stygibacter australis]MDP8321996.1 hypothetical protein [Candidatus Stygibacter australis]